MAYRLFPNFYNLGKLGTSVLPEGTTLTVGSLKASNAVVSDPTSGTTAQTGDNANVLGDIVGDKVDTSVQSVNVAFYAGKVVVNGVTVGLAFYDNNGNWYLATNSTLTTNSTFSLSANSAAGTNQYGIAPTLGLVNDSGALAADNLTNDLRLAGTSSANATITVKDGTTTLGTTTTDAQGAWSFTPSPGLAQGAHSFSIVETSVVGGTTYTNTSATLPVSYDSQAPAVPAIGSVSDNAGAVTGALAAGARTDDTTPTVSVSLAGTGAVAGDTVKLLVNGVQTGSLVLTAADVTAGSVSLTSTALAGDGLKTLTATITDQAGNTSAASAGTSLTLDTTAPTAPGIGSMTDNAGAVVGTFTSGVRTDDTTPTVSVSLIGTGAVAGDTVKLLVNGVQTGSLVLTAADVTAGSVSLTSNTLPNSLLGDGLKTLTTTITDQAGNTSAASAGFTLTLDRTAPTAPAIGSVSDNAGAVTGALAAGARTDDTTPTVSVSLAGTGAVAGDTVKLLVNGVQTGSLVLTAADVTAGSVSLTSTALAGDGLKTLTTTITDQAGNTSAASAGTSLTLDTAGPAAPASLSLANDTGTAGDAVTSDPTITGFAEAGSTVVLKVGATVVGTGTADAVTGAFSITPTGLAQGASTITVTATDAAGNASPAGSIGVTYDSVAPASGAAVVLGNPGGDGIQYGEANAYAFALSGVNGGTATVTFTSSNGGPSVTVSGLANGAHQVDLGSLASGTITATVTVTDDAGNSVGGAGGSIEEVICFYPGTAIRVPGGEVAVERLAVGDLVLTADGGTAPVRWLGRQTVSTRFGDPTRVLPIRIRAGALDEALPVRDLLVSPDHALLVDGVLVQAGALVNGRSILREAAVPEIFTYWHVELGSHALILAEGVPAETFVDNVDRLGFDNWAEYQPQDAAMPEMLLPRAKSARQVPQATRRRLELRAEGLGGDRRAA